GVHSLNGENLQHCIPFRVASDSSPFFTLIRADFFTPPFARRRFTEPSSFSSHGSEKVQLDFFLYFFQNQTAAVVFGSGFVTWCSRQRLQRYPFRQKRFSGKRARSP
ncbi:MAG: hypothetical protein J6S87_09275, partial [Bacteroidales bacterium]|nr:hypothetical protein [Bacteroidales bacterium]